MVVNEKLWGNEPIPPGDDDPKGGENDGEDPRNPGEVVRPPKP
jgi:hypothetical protein